LLIASFLTLNWLGMMAVHEFGHAFGALITGGTVRRVVLHPLAIFRTDVSPNPYPAIVVWLGPIIGCLLPLAVTMAVPRRALFWRSALRFFAGFCLVANGAYIAVGSFERVGDCGEMLDTGTPHWVLLLFGLIAIPVGLLMWHKLGSLGPFIRKPSIVTARMAYLTFKVLFLTLAATVTLSSHAM
jgi:hypothetical protein